jgi:hypothetical protein
MNQMNHVTKRVRSGVGFAVLCVAFVTCVKSVDALGILANSAKQRPSNSARPPQAAPVSPTLERLLIATGLDYTRDKSGFFKVVVSVEGETTLIIASEASLGDGTNPDLKLATLVCPVVVVPKGFKHPAAMLKKIATANDAMLVGKLGVDPETGNVWYSSSFWLRTATAKVLTNELYIAHYLRADLRKELLPFLNE